MKIWIGYGSEHSANLVMLGKFKTPEDATSFLAELEKLERLIQEDDSGDDVFRDFPKKIMDEIFYGRIRFCNDFAPKDLDDFRMDLRRYQRDDDQTIVEFKSDETGWAGLIKMMLNAGARIELFEESNTEE